MRSPHAERIFKCALFKKALIHGLGCVKEKCLRGSQQLTMKRRISSFDLIVPHPYNVLYLLIYRIQFVVLF